MTKPKKSMWHVIAKYGDKQIEYSAETTDEVINILMAWIKMRIEPKDWPAILKWIGEEIKQTYLSIKKIKTT